MQKNSEQKETNYTWIFPGFVFLAGVVYAYFTFTAPITATGRQLGLVGMKLLLIQITFTVPFVATWVIGALAAKNLKRYAGRIPDLQNALGYRHFALGITFLVIGAVLAQLTGIPRNFHEEHSLVIAFLSVVTNYINVIFPLIGFVYFFRGTRELSSSLKIKSDVGIPSATITALLGIMYTLLVFTNPTRQVSVVEGIPPTYYVSDILIVITIVIPVLAAWFFGFRAALAMGEIQSAIMRRQNGFSRLMHGIWLVVFSSIILQGIVSLGAERFLSLGLGVTLALIYVFLIVVGSGYWLTASGSKKLLDSLLS